MLYPLYFLCEMTRSRGKSTVGGKSRNTKHKASKPNARDLVEASNDALATGDYDAATNVR